jgi:hypothetical protein
MHGYAHGGEFYPYHHYPGGSAAASSLGGMLIFALVFIGLIVVFSWAAYVDYQSAPAVCRRTRALHVPPCDDHEIGIWKLCVAEVKGGNRPPPQNVDGIGDPTAPPPPPPTGAAAQLQRSMSSRPLGEALRPPWSRGARVGDADVHNALMASATVGAFFSTRP